MNEATIRALSQLNNEFYANQHESFSATRQAPWDGWRRVAAALEKRGRSLDVLDVACGNMRFERYLLESFPHIRWKFTGVDSCDALAAAGGGGKLKDTRYVHVDVIDRLLEDMPLAAYLSASSATVDAVRDAAPFANTLQSDAALAGAPLADALTASHAGNPFDAAVSFGFMHHIPSDRLRLAFARRLVESVRPGGVVALSFWQFANDGKLASKAFESTERALLAYDFELEENDYIIGWNNLEGAYRYCHSFTEEEIQRMVEELGPAVELLDRFGADGRNGRLNGYLVLGCR